LVDAVEHLFDLLVQLSAVGEDQHPAVRNVLAYPLRQPDHDQALAATLGVPEDPALTTVDTRLCGSHSEVLVVPAGLPYTRVEDDEVVYDLEQPRLAAHLSEFAQQRIITRVRISLRLLPAQPVFLRGLDHPIAQPPGVVAGHHALHRGVEGPDELLPLAVQVLANPFAHGNR